MAIIYFQHFVELTTIDILILTFPFWGESVNKAKSKLFSSSRGSNIPPFLTEKKRLLLNLKDQLLEI